MGASLRIVAPWVRLDGSLGFRQYAQVISTLLLAVLSQTTPPPPPPPPSGAAEALVPSAFFEGVLSWDLEANQAVIGKKRTALTRTEFFEKVGRLDLIEKSQSIRTRRIALLIAAGTVVVAGSVSGAVVLSRSPDMNSAYCVAHVDNFNQCHDANSLHQTAGAGLIAGSVATAALMATLGWWANPDLIDGDEATRLVSQYNAGLLKRLRASKGSLKWLPVVSPDGAALAVSGRF